MDYRGYEINDNFLFVNNCNRVICKTLFDGHVYNKETFLKLDQIAEDFKKSELVDKGVKFEKFQVVLESRIEHSEEDNQYHNYLFAYGEWIETETQFQHEIRIEREKLKIDKKIEKLEKKTELEERKKTNLGRAVLFVESWGGVVSFPNGIKRIEKNN